MVTPCTHSPLLVINAEKRGKSIAKLVSHYYEYEFTVDDTKDAKECNTFLWSNPHSALHHSNFLNF